MIPAEKDFTWKSQILKYLQVKNARQNGQFNVNPST
jgi:hypothetical protein